ncbi:MAG: rubrerythrin family protein [Chloroflexi bacterium]|nr:rubrerythrin family protein [Chloroflexota bacterium]
MRKMTESHLAAAFAGESQAHMRYLIFAQKAQEEGKSNLARLFEAIAFAERVHATNHYRTLGNIKGNDENLGVAIGGEIYEIEEMYPAYSDVARTQGERGAQLSFHYALSAEKIHAQVYTQAQEAIRGGGDVPGGSIFICSVCGHTVLGDVPEKCPVCGKGRETFRQF